MLKITGSLDKSVPSKNNDSKQASKKNNSKDEIDKYGSDSVEHAKKSRKSKGQNLAKSGKLSKLEKFKGKKSKKLSKSGNSPNFDVIEARPNFLTSGAKEAFNCLRLAFTKTPIL